MPNDTFQFPYTIASTEEIRSAFPALERIHRGHSIAYFDGPGGTQVPRAVVDAMGDYLLHHNANTHWAFPTRMPRPTRPWRRRGQSWRIS